MSGRSHRSAGTGRSGPREPAAPEFPAELIKAVLPDSDLVDGGMYESMAFDGLDLSGREATDAEIDQCRFGGVSFSQVRLHRGRIRDAVFDRCDLANLRARGCSLGRATVSACRMTGLSWLDGEFRDVTFDRCRIDLSSLRSSAFRDVVFTECRLEQADFGEADLRGVRFEDCDLTGAQFPDAQLAGARFANCDLSGIVGVTSLRGAIIKASDLLSLTYVLAGALGITIED
ncbi:MAG TPA: pentapeptide repeat-containing protein [Streptosporangiaceae bacterium]|nr:pentapeptide repeat-containing protein [Streptosporangiaceae bacterium]